MQQFSDQQIGFAIKQLGNYRCRRAQTVAAQGPPDGIYGITIIALGLRETGGRNINGGAVWDPHLGKWVKAEPIHQDGGVFQISRDHHPADLKRMPGVREGTWAPVEEDHSAFDPGFCPRFEDSLQFTIREMHEALEFAEDHNVPKEDRARFAVAAHNAGKGGAISGYREGDLDRYTAQGDYSAWVEAHAKKVKRWLDKHPGWRP